MGIKVTLFQIGLVNNDLGNTPGSIEYLPNRKLVESEDVALAMEYALHTRPSCIPTHIVLTPHGSVLQSTADSIQRARSKL